MNSLLTLPNIVFGPFVIRVSEYMDKGNWSYTVYLVQEKKWKRKRGKQGYKSSAEAKEKAEAYLTEFGHRHLEPKQQ